MIKYIASVNGKDCVTHVLTANDKNVSVIFEPQRRGYSNDIIQAQFKYGSITVHNDMTISSSHSHFAEILLAIELVRVIKESSQGDSK